MKESVGAIIYFKNLYLIQKRSLKRNIYFPGIFGVFGGNVNKKEKVHQAIFREIKEELDIDLKYYQVKYFLKISINSKHFKKGDSYHLLNSRKLNKLKFVPWDLSAILYFENYIRQKRSVKPKKF